MPPAKPTSRPATRVTARSKPQPGAAAHVAQRGPAPTALAEAEPLLAEPASLTQISSSAAVRCPVCDGTRLTRIALVLTDGSPVDFTSCHNCEHRAWVHEGAPLEIDTVLAKARKPR